MMRYALTVIMVVVVLVLLWWVSHASTATAELEEWTPRTLERRWRLVVAILVVMWVFGAFSLTWIQDLSRQSQTLAQDNCHDAEDFRALLARRATAEIRELAGRRDDLADAVAEARAGTEEVPGFADMDAAVQEFVRALIAADIAEAAERLDEYDRQLAESRAEVDQIRAFALAVDCPGQSQTRPPVETVPVTTEAEG